MHVETFSEKYVDDFVRLNREWIERFFRIEKMDLEQLENASSLRSGGGEIFFVVDEGRVVGTCAMIPHAASSFELAKMAVDPSARGR